MTALATAWETLLGETVVVQAWTSEGSYARVYRGAYGDDGRPCALKVPKPEIAGAPGLVSREADLLARVREPQVVRLTDRGIHGGGPFLVLEWLEGETLRTRLERAGRLPLRTALEVLADVGAALAAFHAHAAHGDVRPENVLLVPGRGAVLIDPLVPEGDPYPPEGDLAAAAGLLHHMLTGAEAEREIRLTPGAGYNPEAVLLWERLQTGAVVTARELHAHAYRLRQSL